MHLKATEVFIISTSDRADEIGPSDFSFCTPSALLLFCLLGGRIQHILSFARRFCEDDVRLLTSRGYAFETSFSLLITSGACTWQRLCYDLTFRSRSVSVVVNGRTSSSGSGLRNRLAHQHFSYFSASFARYIMVPLCLPHTISCES